MIIGSLIQGFMGQKAAKQQAAAVQQGIEVTRQNFLDSIELMKPSIEAGDLARNAYMFNLGLGDRPTYSSGNIDDLKIEQIGGGAAGGAGGGAPNGLIDGRRVSRYDGTYYDGEGRVTSQIPMGPFADGGGAAAGPGRFAVGGKTFDTWEEANDYLTKLKADSTTEYAGFRETPGYQFNVSEGQKAIDRSAAARGMALSSSTLKAHERFRTGLADQTYGEYMNRLAGVSGAGQAASTTTFGGYQQNAAALSDLYGQKGNALAAGTSAFGQAIGSGVNNIFRGIGLFSKPLGLS